MQRYTAISSTDLIGRAPKDWQFQGSNDGINWTTLDTQSGQAFPYRFQMHSYTVANPAAYRWYQLNITSNNGDTAFTTLSEIGLYAAKP